MHGLADHQRNRTPLLYVSIWEAIEVSPERKLLASVIGSAIKDLYAPFSRKQSVKNARRAAKMWLFGKGGDADEPLLFTDCCEALGICSATARKHIRKLTREDLRYLARKVGVPT